MPINKPISINAFDFTFLSVYITNYYFYTFKKNILYFTSILKCLSDKIIIVLTYLIFYRIIMDTQI